MNEAVAPDTGKVISPFAPLRSVEFKTNGEPKTVEAPADLALYDAGLPGFPRNFARDGVISAILAEDAAMLRDQLRFCARLQGAKKDPHTGEEPGKIFHEYPGYVIDGLSTLYNACETTALFVLGHEYYETFTSDKTLASAHAEQLSKAVMYILAHLKDGIFSEDPAFSGAARFALRVTYWKDSEISDRENGQPSYSVAYFLAHAMNLAALRAASRLLKRTDLGAAIEAMKAGIMKFYDAENKNFYIARDQKGPISGITSDGLHSLFYLQQGDMPADAFAGMLEKSRALEVLGGYRTNFRQIIVGDPYHVNTLWPFEQAIIHAGAKKFGLEHVAEVSSRILPFLDTDPEIFVLEGEGMKKGGCDPQLWTIAAKIYCKKHAAPLPVEIAAAEEAA